MGVRVFRNMLTVEETRNRDGNKMKAYNHLEEEHHFRKKNSRIKVGQVYRGTPGKKEKKKKTTTSEQFKDMKGFSQTCHSQLWAFPREPGCSSTRETRGGCNYRGRQ